VLFITGNRNKMAGGKSEKGAGLNEKIQPFAREFFDAISLVKQLSANESHVFFHPKPQ
jgi:hypothetical protein